MATERTSLRPLLSSCLVVAMATCICHHLRSRVESLWSVRMVSQLPKVILNIYFELKLTSSKQVLTSFVVIPVATAGLDAASTSGGGQLREKGKGQLIYSRCDRGCDPTETHQMETGGHAGGQPRMKTRVATENVNHWATSHKMHIGS